MRLEGKNIMLGITGSIAAYKAAILLRLLIKEGAEVQVVITEAGKQFITPVTLSALSGKPVISEFFGTSDGSWNSHVDLGLCSPSSFLSCYYLHTPPSYPHPLPPSHFIGHSQYLLFLPSLPARPWE